MTNELLELKADVKRAYEHEEHEIGEKCIDCDHMAGALFKLGYRKSRPPLVAKEVAKFLDNYPIKSVLCFSRDHHECDDLAEAIVAKYGQPREATKEECMKAYKIASQNPPQRCLCPKDEICDCGYDHSIEKKFSQRVPDREAIENVLVKYDCGEWPSSKRRECADAILEKLKERK